MGKVLTFTNSSDKDVYLPLMGQSGAFAVIPALAGVDGSEVPAFELDAEDIVWYPASDFNTFYTDFLAQYPQITMEAGDSTTYAVDVSLAYTDGTAISIVSLTVDTTVVSDISALKLETGTYKFTFAYKDKLDADATIEIEGIKITAGTNSVAVYVAE